MPMQKLKSFLDEQKVKYVTIRHSPAYTAQEIAASAHVPGNEIAKTVIVRLDGEFAMVVLPGDRKIDFRLLGEVTGHPNAVLATEDEFAKLFPGCEVGAMPPFGNLFDLDVYVAESLAEDERIAFNAGSHTELIRMTYADFERIVRPKVLKLT